MPLPEEKRELQKFDVSLQSPLPDFTLAHSPRDALTTFLTQMSVGAIEVSVENVDQQQVHTVDRLREEHSRDMAFGGAGFIASNAASLTNSDRAKILDQITRAFGSEAPAP